MAIMGDGNDEDSEFIYELNDRGQQVKVRSTESTHKVFLRYTNRTSRPVDVWWRDFRGSRRFYQALKPGEFCDINTFMTHPWEFTDAATKERYVINNRAIYRAPRQAAGIMYRTNWNITVGMRTLRDTAMLAIAESLRDPEAIPNLGLPKVISEDLQTVADVVYRHKLDYN